MTTTILHEEATPVFAPATGLNIIPCTFFGVAQEVDFGDRSVSARLRTEILSTAGPGATFAWAVDLADSALGPLQWHQTVSRPVPVSLIAPSVWDIGVTNQQFPALQLPPRTGFAQFLRASLLIFRQSFGGSFAAFGLKITLFDDENLVVQGSTPVPGANVYLSIADILERMSVWGWPTPTAFPALPAADQEAIWIAATERIEALEEVLCRITGAPISSDLDVQTLLWGRNGAVSSTGADIIGLPLESWTDALGLFAEEMAKAHSAGESVAEPLEDQGVVKVEVQPGKADYSKQWKSDGFDGGFFEAPGRALMWDLLSKSLRLKGRR